MKSSAASCLRKLAGRLPVLFLLLVGAGCATLPDNTGREPSTAYRDDGTTRLGGAFGAVVEEHPGQSGFHLLRSGTSAFAARAATAALAQRSIDLQYYLFHQDLTGKLLDHELLEAADRGVRVRLLVDDIDLGGRDQGMLVADSHPNIEIRVFNPFSRRAARLTQYLSRFGKVTRRMHNKSFTVDGQLTIVGGRNIGDEYFNANPDLAFGDLDVLGVGPVVEAVARSFDQYWNDELAYPIATLVPRPPPPGSLDHLRAELKRFREAQRDSAYLAALKESDFVRHLSNGDLKFYWGTAEVVADAPEKLRTDPGDATYRLSPHLGKHFGRARNELIVASAYFVPGWEGVAFFSDLERRGVEVTVLTNSLASTDVPIVHSGYAKYRKALLRAGVELYEMSPEPDLEGDKKRGFRVSGSSRASLHAKAFDIDRKVVFIGTLNLDPRSVEQNTEIGIVITAPELGAEMAERFLAEIERGAFRVSLEEKDGRERLVWTIRRDEGLKRFTSEPYSSLWRRFMAGFLRILPIDSQI